jgi:hypothetical protein
MDRLRSRSCSIDIFVADDRTNCAQSPRDRLKTPWAPKGNWALVEGVMSERESRQG